MPNAIANRYHVVSTLGEGGMGKVLAVKDTVSDREVALKLLHASGAHALQQLKYEFWTMTRLRHPSTVEVYDYGLLPDGTPYFTMEIVHGASLERALPMPPRQVRDVLASLCRVLGYVHAQGYVHLDLKPENIRLLEDGRLKLMDFGLMERTGRTGGPIRGTLAYLAPEVARSARVDQRADLYSLGAVAYHLLTGRAPFEGDRAITLIKAHLESPVPMLENTSDPALEGIVMRLLAKDPVRRFQSAAEVLSALGFEAEDEPAILLSPALVGRQAQIEAFVSWLGRPEGGLMRLVGPLGAGKTRLAEEFVLLAKCAEKATVSVRCYEHEPPYRPIAEALRRLLPVARSRAPTILERHAPVLARILPELGTGPALESLEPQHEKRRLHASITEVLGAVARHQGLLLVIDAAEWLDASTVELLEHLLRSAESLPLFLVLAGAPESMGGEALVLDDLTPPDAEAMLASMLGSDQLDAGFAAPLLTLSAGNPRFLCDLLHHLVESKLLLRARAGWQPAPGFSVAKLPSDLQGMLGRQLSSLEPRTLAVARAVALASSGASLAFLSAIEPQPDETLFEALGELTAEGLVEAGPSGYVFANHQLQALVYDSMAVSERQALHTKAADALLPWLDPRELPVLQAITDHLLASETPERAAPVAILAAERNLELFANDEARRYFEAGLRLLAAGADSGLRLGYLVGMADVDRRLGSFAQAQSTLESALALCEGLGMPLVLARILTSLGKVHQAMGRYDPAREVLARAVEVAGAAGAARERIRALTTLGRVTYFGGDVPEATRIYATALEASREADLPLLLAECLAFLGYLFASDPDRQQEGLGYLQESLELKRAVGDKVGLNDTTVLLGNAYLAMGRYQEANACFLESQSLNAEIGQTDEGNFSDINLSIVALELGDLQEAKRLAGMACACAVASKSRFAEGMARALLGVAELYLGTLTGGMREIEAGLQLAREMSNRYLEASISVYYSDALIRLGRYSEARSYAASALALAEASGVREVVMQQQVLLGLAHLLMGDREAARAVLTQARQAASSSRARGVEAKAVLALARLAAQSRDFNTAQQLAHEALQDAEELGVRVLSVEAQTLLGELQLKQDHRSLATEHLRTALNLTEGFGSPWLHARILRLLAETDPLRGESLRRLADNEAERLYATLAEGDREQFEAAWLRPWVGEQPTDLKRALTLEKRLAGLGAEISAIVAQVREQESRSAGLDTAHRRLEQLIDFALKINQVHDLQLVLEMAMDLILEITHAERGFLVLCEEGQIRVSQLRHLVDDPEDSQWMISRSIAEEVLRSEQPVCLQDALSDPRFEHAVSVQQLRVRTVLCVPLKIRHAVVGALYVDRQTVAEAFLAQDLDVVTSLAALTSTAIENAKLHSEWQDKSRKLEMLNTLSRTMSTTLVMDEVLDLAVRSTLELTQAERGFLFLWETERLVCRSAYSRTLERLAPRDEPYSQTICQQVLDSGESLCVADALADEELQVQASIQELSLRTVMCVPLIAKQTLLGLLYVDSQAIVNTFRDRDLELLEAIAHQVSVAIENAHLYSQLERRASELESLVQLYEEANLRASTDALTNLHNRRFFLDQLSRDFAQARRHRRHLCVIVLDIDHFKSFNDTYGHALGDQVLTCVSTVLLQAVRLADVVARYGGEEFTVSLPDTDLDGALVVAERIRRSVAEIVLSDPDGNALRQITVSLGVSSLRLEDERTAELIERADRALYVAKVKGRNQIQVIEE